MGRTKYGISMIDKAHLSTLYDRGNFNLSVNPLKIEEKQEDDAKLKSVEFQYNGLAINIKPSFIEQNIHATKFKLPNSKNLSFRKKCDGIFLLNKDEVNYIVCIALKSGYNAVCQDAIYQIAVSNIKVKSHLINFEDFKKEEYVELGIIVSFPPTPSDKWDSENNNIVTDHKIGLVSKQAESITQKYDKAFRKDGYVIMNGSDFNLDKLPLVSDLHIKDLYIKHEAVTSNSANINLDTILDNVIYPPNP